MQYINVPACFWKAVTDIVNLNSEFELRTVLYDTLFTKENLFEKMLRGFFPCVQIRPVIQDKLLSFDS